MKLAISALLAVLFLGVVSANGGAFIESESDELAGFDYYPEDIDEFGITWTIAKAALRTVKAFGCTFREINNIKIAAVQFVNDIAGCGASAATKQMISLVKACKNLINTSSNLIHIKSTCNSNSSDGTTTPVTPKKCFFQTFGRLMQLNYQIGKIITSAAKVSLSSVGQCSKVALSQLTSSFTAFPKDIIQCSKLTSN